LDEVGSTAYETRNQTLGLAFKSGNHLVEAKFGYQNMPEQLYPNQRMDLLDNEQKRINLRYLGEYDWGALEARAYNETVDHYMDFGPDKKFLYTDGNTTQGMPMNTKGKTTGVSVKGDVKLSEQDVLRLGTEYQHYALQDWWPAVVGSMGMGPNDFININDGERERSAVFAEWEKRITADFTTLAGLRYEQVKTSAGMVHGYNSSTAPIVISGMDMMNQKRDAVAFNNSDRNKTDNNWDVTAMGRYVANPNTDLEFGVARKVRSPNLYERYTWSTADMMTIMNNTVGDGNGYLGDVNLKSEKAYTVSTTLDWHAANRDWELKATPYYTHVTDYIDAVQLTPTTNAFTSLRYTNQSARLYGLDVTGHMPLAQTGAGLFALKGLLNYTNGENRATGDDLYNIMPLNGKLTLTHNYQAWDSALELQMVKAKDHTSDARNEIKTAGYSLINLRSSYNWKQARLDFGVENLFDKHYYLPLGGAYVGQGATMGMQNSPIGWGTAVPGMGRSVNVGLTLKY
jgi:iron complex outermembrane receptor protein